MTERLHFHFSLSCIGEGNGSPLQCSLYKRNLLNGKCLLIWELLMLLLFQWVLYDLVYLILVWFQEIGICYWPQSCCFTIPLHPDDQPRFAFSVPCINLKESHKRFQWTALPQCMLNSPTICQNFVAKAVNPVRQQFFHAFIIHYMDDILCALPEIDSLQGLFLKLKDSDC